jgi:zinc protease
MQGIVRLRRPVLFALAAALLVAAAPASAAPAPPRKVRTVEGITEYGFDNGLRLLLLPDPSSPRVTVNMVVLVGSRHEGYGETGMAHLLEHMLFRGTPTIPNILKALEAHGARAQGTTHLDYTNFYETLPAGDANLDFAVRIEADRLVNCYVSGEDFRAEMTVVRSEFEKGENLPLAILRQRIRAAAYLWHNYGKDVIGNRSDIERVPIDRLRAFYHKYYRPDNVVLVVAGKFDEARALERVTRYFGPLKRAARPLDETYTEEPPQDGERNVVLRRVGAVPVVGVSYHVPAGRHEDYPALCVLANALLEEPAGRLHQALVRSGKADALLGFADAQRDAGLLEVFARLDAKHPVEPARDTMIRVVEGLATAPVTEEEVRRVQRGYAAGFEQAAADSTALALGLSEFIAQGDWRLLFLLRDRIAKVTPADVTRVAGRYLRQNNRTLGVYQPTGDAQRVAVPAASPAAALLEGYRGTATVSAGEAFEPTPENIEKRVERTRLPGGVKVALLPKRTRGQFVTGVLRLHYGNERSLKDHPVAAPLLGQLMLAGTRKHDRGQLENELNRRQAGITAGGDLGGLTFTLRCKREHFPRVLRLLGEILREPTFPEHEVRQTKLQIRQSLAEARTDPDRLAGMALLRRLNPYPTTHIRYEPTLDETLAQLDAMTADELRRLHAEQVGGEAGEFAAVGEFDPAEARRLLAEVLHDWKSAVRYGRIAQPARTDARPGRLDLRVPDKANAVFVAGERLAMRADHPDYLALRTANYILGGSAGSRLWVRVRQRDGLSYTVYSTFAASDLDAAAKFGLYANCNPRNIDRVDQAVADELARFVRDGVTEAELAEAKKAILQHWTLNRSDDGGLAGMLAADLQTGQSFHDETAAERKLGRLTVAEVNRAIRKHLAPGRLVIVRSGDLPERSARRTRAAGTPVGAAPAR